MNGISTHKAASHTASDPFPLNNGTHSAAPFSGWKPDKNYCLEKGRVGRETTRKREVCPLNPAGAEIMESEKLSLRGFLNATKTPKISNQKAYTAGDHFEITEYFTADMQPMNFLYDYRQARNPPREEKIDVSQTEEGKYIQMRKELISEGWPLEKINEIYPEPEPELKEGEKEDLSAPSEENRIKSLKRAKNTARLIIQEERFDMMWTFTFSLEKMERAGITRILEPELQKDRIAVHQEWEKFHKRLKRAVKKEGIEYKWLKVLEIHDGTKTDPRKKGTYHIHLATNLRLNKMALQRVWGLGIVHFTDFTKDLHNSGVNSEDARPVDTSYSKDPSFYMCKYIDKDFDEARKRKEKAYTKSRNVKAPKPIRDRKEVEERRRDPLKAFELTRMCREIREALNEAKMEDLKLFAQDLGHGEGVYKMKFKKWESSSQEFVWVDGFVKKSYYSACLALPKYKARYERFLEKKRKDREQKRQLALF